VNRLCGSGMNAVGTLARAILAGEAQIGIAGRRGEHVARALRDAQGRERLLAHQRVYDTTIGWRFINPKMKAKYGVDQMPETAENVAVDYKVSRDDQDAVRAALAAARAGGAGLGILARRSWR
jgi:acetyl-CoA acetyltransferase